MTRDLQTETHLRGLSVWYRLCGIFFVGCATLTILQLLHNREPLKLTSQYLNVGFISFALWMGAGSYLLGEFLKRYYA
jgi:hypothetical protein